MILTTSFLDAGTWVPLGSLVIVAAVCWRMASAKAEYAADLRHLQQEMAGTNTKLDGLTVAVKEETDKIWESHSKMGGRVSRIEGRLNGTQG